MHICATVSFFNEINATIKFITQFHRRLKYKWLEFHLRNCQLKNFLNCSAYVFNWHNGTIGEMETKHSITQHGEQTFLCVSFLLKVCCCCSFIHVRAFNWNSDCYKLNWALRTHFYECIYSYKWYGWMEENWLNFARSHTHTTKNTESFILLIDLQIW